jgi:hypothetical protein
MKKGSASPRKPKPNPNQGSQMASAKDAALTGDKTPSAASRKDTIGAPLKKMATKRGSVRLKTLPTAPVAISVNSIGANTKIIYSNEILTIARQAGVDPQYDDQEILDILFDFVETALPEGWQKEKDPSGEVVYFYSVLNVTTKVHPNISILKGVINEISCKQRTDIYGLGDRRDGRTRAAQPDASYRNFPKKSDFLNTQATQVTQTAGKISVVSTENQEL